MSDRDNITLPREVVQDALDALTGADDFSPGGTPIYMQEITALRTALAAPRLEVTVDPRLTAEEAAAISAAIDARKKEQSDDLLREFRNGAFVQNALAAPVQPRCDGNHSGPRCDDPECWNDATAPRAHLAAEPQKQEAKQEPGLIEGLAELARQMKPLDADMAAILNANLDSLYIEDEPALAAEQPKHDLMKWAKDAGSSPEDLERFATYTIATRDMEIATLREENEALRRDAEQGRWLREWLDNNGLLIRAIRGESLTGYEHPDIEALRRDAERFRWGVENARWVRHEHEAYVAIPVAVDADLSCTPMMTAAIDAAMKEGT